MHLEGAYKFKCTDNYKVCALKKSSIDAGTKYESIVTDEITFDFKNNELIKKSVNKDVEIDYKGNKVLTSYQSKKINYNYQNDSFIITETENGKKYKYIFDDNIIVDNYDDEGEIEYQCDYVTVRLLKNKCEVYKEDIKEIKDTTFKKYIGNYSKKDIIKK